MARLAFPQLHRPFSQGGLGFSSLVKRAKSLLVKQVFRQLSAGRPSSSITGWVLLFRAGFLCRRGPFLSLARLPPSLWPSSTSCWRLLASPVSTRPFWRPQSPPASTRTGWLTTPHPAQAPAAPLGPHLEEAGDPLPASSGCGPPFSGLSTTSSSPWNGLIASEMLLPLPVLRLLSIRRKALFQLKM